MSRLGWWWFGGRGHCGGRLWRQTASPDQAQAEATSDSAWGRVLDAIEETGVPLDVAVQATGDIPDPPAAICPGNAQPEVLRFRSETIGISFEMDPVEGIG
jgi:hypothetical protein